MNGYAPGLALAMGGGGARAAYQVGILRHVARRFPGLSIPILTGVSAGAINTAFIANHPDGLVPAVDDLSRLWRNLSTDQVFESDSLSLIKMAVRWGLRLVSGGSGLRPRTRGLVDTKPLHKFLMEHLDVDEEGRLVGIQKNLDRGGLRAASITATNYATGQSVTWVQGRDVCMWRRPHRMSQEAAFSVAHVMASSALPLFFPAVRVGEEWYGDGGIRLTAPLSPALHLGAERILAISTRYRRSLREAEDKNTIGYPPPAHVLGVLMNAIFLDMFDFDADNLARLNELVRRLPEPQRMGLRVVELLVLRPSVDLGKLAGRYELKLPSAFRFMTRGLGTRETKSPDSLSMVMFEPSYVGQLLDLGEADAAARHEDLEAFLTGKEMPSLDRTSIRRI
jgi:NTE family protein